MNQGDLFERKKRYPEAPGHRGVRTSVAAADSIEPHVSRLRQIIINYLAINHSGLIYTEIVSGTGLLTPTVCGRLREMVIAGWVRDSQITRPTPSGRQATVYVLTSLGQSKVTQQRQNDCEDR